MRGEDDDITMHIKREKAKAREMRKTRWWQLRLAHARCYYCQKDLAQAEVTMDHVVPLSRGGRSTKGNIATACKQCNTLKKNLTPVEWEAYLVGQLDLD